VVIVDGKLELPGLGSQAGAWEPAQSRHLHPISVIIFPDASSQGGVSDAQLLLSKDGQEKTIHNVKREPAQNRAIHFDNQNIQ
jgi:hypothetical protein